MKRVLALILALMVLAAVPFASGESLPSYTLTEKMERQVAIGSGFRGSMTFQISGSSDFASTWGMMSDVPLELRAIRSGFDFQTDVYAFANEIEYGRTKFFGNDLEVALVSELVPGKKIAFPIDSTLINILFPREENPSMISAMESLLTLTEEEQAVWAETFAPYFQEVERWLNTYATTPDLSENEAGEKVMSIAYEIPFSAVASEAVNIISKLASDTEARSLLETKLTPEQMALYLNPNLAYYYESAMKGLSLEGSISLAREMTTMGKVLSTRMTFPMAENRWGYQTLTLESDEETLDVTLSSEAATLSVSLLEHKSTRDHVAYDGIIRLVQLEDSEEKSISAHVNYVMRRTSAMDSEGTTHDQLDISLHISPDLSHLEEGDPERDRYDQFVDIVAYAAIQMHSKNSNLSPTYADAEVRWTSDGLDISGKGNFRTSSAWVMDGLTTGDGQLYAAMTKKDQETLLDTFLQKLQEMATTVRVVLGLEEGAADTEDRAEDAAAAPDVTDGSSEEDEENQAEDAADASISDEEDGAAEDAASEEGTVAGASTTPGNIHTNTPRPTATPTAPPTAKPTATPELEELPLPAATVKT